MCLGKSGIKDPRGPLAPFPTGTFKRNPKGKEKRREWKGWYDCKTRGLRIHSELGKGVVSLGEGSI